MPLHAVVTGAGGFIGGYIAKYLAAKGCLVTAPVRLKPTGDASFHHLLWRHRDLLDHDALPHRFDVLVHCAAELPFRITEPALLYRANIDMAQNCFRQAVDAGAKTIIFLSSMSVYGKISAPVVREHLEPVAPDAYGRAKRDIEEMLRSMIGANGFESGLSIRLPGTVGKGSHHNFLSDALTNILNGDVVHAQNADGFFNNIVYVGDLARFVGQWIDAPMPGYAVTNLAAEKAILIRELISMMFVAAGRTEKVEYIPANRPNFLISLERAGELGYRPSTVRDSVSKFIVESLAS
jgi:nucleoside-diphosphate-sugar epimerase